MTVFSSDDDDVEEVFVIAPARRADTGSEENLGEARHAPLVEEVAHVDAPGGSSSGPRGDDASGALPQQGMKKRRWVARDE